MTETTTRTVGTGDDLITYDVHGDLASVTPDRPALFAFASPMEAAAFGALAAELADRVVVTYDPRGTGRNPRGTDPMTAPMHAGDLHRVVADLGVGPVDAFASSGGAVNLLAWLSTHPDDVRRAVVHEPPIVTDLVDSELALAALEDICATYAAQGDGAAMAKFIALVMQPDVLPADYLDQPAPSPEAFGMSADDDGERTNPLIRNMPACNLYQPDYAAIAAMGDRVVVAVGAESGNEMAARGGHAVAGRIGRPAVVVPSHHAGFCASDGMPQGDPVAFAAALREIYGF